MFFSCKQAFISFIYTSTSLYLGDQTLINTSFYHLHQRKVTLQEPLVKCLHQQNQRCSPPNYSIDFHLSSLPNQSLQVGALFQETCVHRRQCFEVVIGCIALMQSQQTIDPEMIVVASWHLLIGLHVKLKGLVFGVGKEDKEVLYLWESQPFVVADAIDFGHGEEALHRQFLSDKILRQLVFVQILHIRDYAFPIRNQLLIPTHELLIDCFSSSLLLFQVFFLILVLNFFTLYLLLPTGMLPLSAQQEVLFLSPDCQDVRESLSFLFCEIFSILFNVKGWARHQFILFAVLLFSHFGRFLVSCFS